MVVFSAIHTAFITPLSSLVGIVPIPLTIPSTDIPPLCTPLQLLTSWRGPRPLVGHSPSSSSLQGSRCPPTCPFPLSHSLTPMLPRQALGMTVGMEFFIQSQHTTQERGGGASINHTEQHVWDRKAQSPQHAGTHSHTLSTHRERGVVVANRCSSGGEGGSNGEHRCPVWPSR